MAFAVSVGLVVPDIFLYSLFESFMGLKKEVVKTVKIPLVLVIILSSFFLSQTCKYVYLTTKHFTTVVN